MSKKRISFDDEIKPLPAPIKKSKKEIEGGLAFLFGSKTDNNLKKYGKEKIKKIEIFRKPLDNKLVEVLNKLTNDKVDAFLKKQPYDKFFHLGILINDKYAFDKQESYTFVKVNKNSFLKNAETSPVNFNKDITINELVDMTKKRMGDTKFKGYHPLKNNCQDFVLNALDSIGATYNKEFVKQDVAELSKQIPSWKQKISEFVVGLARGVKKITGQGSKKNQEWIQHLAKTKRENSSLTHKEAVMKASETYKKKEKDEEPKKEKSNKKTDKTMVQTTTEKTTDKIDGRTVKILTKTETIKKKL